VSRKEIIIYSAAGWFLFGVICGMANSALLRDLNLGTGCIYKSVMSLSNPGYILGCEFVRKRFEIIP